MWGLDEQGYGNEGLVGPAGLFGCQNNLVGPSNLVVFLLFPFNIPHPKEVPSKKKTHMLSAFLFLHAGQDPFPQRWGYLLPLQGGQGRVLVAGGASAGSIFSFEKGWFETSPLLGGSQPSLSFLAF